MLNSFTFDTTGRGTAPLFMYYLLNKTREMDVRFVLLFRRSLHLIEPVGASNGIWTRNLSSGNWYVTTTPYLQRIWHRHPHTASWPTCYSTNFQPLQSFQFIPHVQRGDRFGFTFYIGFFCFPWAVRRRGRRTPLFTYAFSYATATKFNDIGKSA